MFRFWGKEVTSMFWQIYEKKNFFSSFPNTRTQTDHTTHANINRNQDEKQNEDQRDISRKWKLIKLIFTIMVFD